MADDAEGSGEAAARTGEELAKSAMALRESASRFESVESRPEPALSGNASAQFEEKQRSRLIKLGATTAVQSRGPRAVSTDAVVPTLEEQWRSSELEDQSQFELFQRVSRHFGRSVLGYIEADLCM